MKKALAALVVVLVVAIAAALVAPSFIDWTGHKASIEREISAATGRTLAIDGHVEAALLPTPRFVATNLRLAGPDAATDLARVARVELRLAWAPLLAFRIQITSIRLVDPELSLPALTQPPTPGSAGDSAPSTVPTWRSVRLDNVVIENGRLILPAPSGAPPSTVEQISGRLSAESLTGPVRAAGAAVAQGIPLTFDAVLGDFASTRAVPASLNVELRPGLGKLQYRGTLARDGTRWTAQGRVTADSANFAAALAAAGIPVSADAPMAGALAQAFALGATFNGDGAAWTINDAMVQLGDARAEGAASLLLGPRPAVDAAFAISRLDVDRLRRLPPPASAAPAARATGAPAPGTRLPAAPTARPGWFRGVDMSLDLSVDALVLGDGVLRQVRINVVTRRDDLVINQASAQLPGGSEIVLIGQIEGPRDDPGAARIDGAVEVNSNNLRALLQWAGIDVAAVPRDRLRRFEGTARLEGTLARPTFSAIDVRLDSSRLTGGLTLAVGDRVAFGADLRLDQLNVDAYRLTEPVPSAGAAPAGTAAPAPQSSPLDWLNRFDTNLRLRIASLTWGTATADGLVADLTLSQGAIELRELAVRALAGATLRATGRLANLATAPSASLDLELKATEADGILRLAGVNLPPGLGALALSGHLDARQGDDIALRGLDLRLGETHLTGQARLASMAPRLAWSADLTGDTVSLDILANSMAVRPRAAQPALAAPVLRNPAASAGRNEAGWSRQSLGLASLGEMDADIALSARLLSIDKLKLADARLALKLRETMATLTSLTGSVSGGRLEGAASLDLRQVPALSATGTLTGVELRQVLDLIAGADALRGPADLRFDLRASGDSQAALIGTLAGTLQIASPGGTIEGYDLPAMSEKLKRIDRPTDLITLVQLGLGGGRTPFTDLEGNLRIESGVARTDDLKLVAKAGEMRTTGTIDLPRWTLDLVNEFRLTEHPKLPPLALKISGPIDAPRRIFDIERLQSHLLRRGSEGSTR